MLVMIVRNIVKSLVGMKSNGNPWSFYGTQGRTQGDTFVHAAPGIGGSDVRGIRRFGKTGRHNWQSGRAFELVQAGVSRTKLLLELMDDDKKTSRLGEEGSESLKLGR